MRSKYWICVPDLPELTKCLENCQALCLLGSIRVRKKYNTCKGRILIYMYWKRQIEQQRMIELHAGHQANSK
jgi:hypothetical protein